MSILIVGGGIAGIAVHFRLRQAGIDAHMMDQALEGNSSRAAAGIINPLTGSNFAKSWNFDYLLPELFSFYEDVSQLLGVNVLKKLDFNRYLNSLSQVNAWLMKTTLSDYEPYCGQADPISVEKNKKNLYKVKVENAYHVNMMTLIDGYHSLLRKEGLFTEGIIAYDQVFPDGEVVRISKDVWDQVIFCEGWRVNNNPFFNYLPVIPNWGQALVLKNRDSMVDRADRFKNLLCYQTPEHCWYGATMRPVEGLPADFNSYPQSLEDDFIQDYDQAPEILDIKSGLRPTVRDRKPIIGRHPAHPRLMCFNGLGTKGASLAPWLSGLLPGYLSESAILPAEVDIRRFDHLWSKIH